MIRERVSTSGMIRPLEHEDDLPTFRLSPQLFGITPVIILVRAAKQAADQKVASTIKSIEKARVRNIEFASQDFAQRAAVLQPGSAGGGEAWRLMWALDADEHPPPSSIVGRLDTERCGSHRLQIRNSCWSLQQLLAAAVVVGRIHGGPLGLRL